MYIQLYSIPNNVLDFRIELNGIKFKLITAVSKHKPYVYQGRNSLVERENKEN